MGLVRRPDSPYWYIQFQFEGCTHLRSSRTTERRVAERMEREWRSELHAKRHLGVRDRITVNDAIESFCDARKDFPSHRVMPSQGRIVAKHLKGHRYLDQVTTQDLERFKHARMSEGMSPQTVKHGITFVIGMVKHVSKLGYAVPELRAPEIRLPKMPVRYLSAAEEAKLLEALDPFRTGRGLSSVERRSPLLMKRMQDAFDLVVLLLDTGARYSEIANIKWSRIDLQKRAIHLWRSKVQNETILYMTDRVAAILERRSACESGLYVFESASGGPRGYAGMAIRKAMKRAGLVGCRIHTFRHTHASRLVQNGMSVHEVKEILGHSDIKTTLRYAHLESRSVAVRAREILDRIGGGG